MNNESMFLSPLCLCMTISTVMLSILALPLNSIAQTTIEGGYDKSLERAVVLFSEGKYPEAAEIFTALAELEPGRKEAILWLGKTEMKQENWAVARAAFKNYTEQAPGDYQGFRWLASACEQDGNLDLAILYYSKAQALNPTDIEIQQAAARVEKLQIAPTQAIQAETTTVSKPDDDSFWSEGLFGVLGARKRWWGWVLALLFYIPQTLNGPFVTAKMQMARFGGLPVFVVLFPIFSIVIGAAWFAILWGIPNSALGWGLLALCSATSGVSAYAGAKQI